MTDDLFAAMDAPDDVTRPLAVRMRPASIDDVVGQSRVLGEGSPLRRLANPASKGSLTAPSSIILFGPPGVGKTTLAYIVAKQSGRVFEELSAVTSGVKDVRDVLKRAHDRLVSEGQETVLFIDEVHNLVGTGDSEGTMNAANILKPALSRGEIQVIGATTFTEYRKFIEKDAALERRFQPVKIEEPSVEDAYKMLLGIKGYYEQYHKVQISDTLVYKAVLMSCLLYTSDAADE